MDGMDGIATAKKIREIDPTCALIFITCSPGHALESYSVRGSAYVVKPIDEKKIHEALFTCREIFLRNARFIEIRVNRANLRIPLIKIYYIEIYDNYALFHTTGGDYNVRMTLDEILKQLGGKPFYRCHKSYIINSNHIGKLDGNDVLMINGDKVPIRKNRRDEVRVDLADMMNSQMFEV
jgi:DNA-binding LytR/AlgR family response regulator